MGKILQTHPKAVQAHKDIVLRCLDDKDESIRLRYISVLVELTKVEGTKHGAKIAEQIQDVTVENAHVLLAGSAQQRNNISEVLLAAAWICGEYSQHVRNVQSVLESMLRARTSVMSGHILSVYVQNIGKLYSTLLSKAEE
ncbi:unnamed protein product, partial [Strongylus vulgaris]